MNLPRYRTAYDLRCAYYASRQEELPDESITAWLWYYALRQGKVDGDSFAHAETLLEASILDVEDLVENFLELNLFIDDLTPFDRCTGASVFGLAVPETGSIKICLRAADYRPLYRSTVMHEIAHMILHQGKRTRTLCYSPYSARRPPEEQEADRFMAEALLPKPLLYLAIVLAGRPYELQENEAFGAANTVRGRFQWRKFYFPFFLNRLCLSRELVAVRMSQQHVFDESTRKFHRTYPIPNRWRAPAPLAFASVIEATISALDPNLR
jgi:hypothetical protein